LREKIAKRMNERMGKNLHSEDILITSGSQQALDMSGMVFLDEGDVIFCERPSYLGAMNAFNSYYPEYVEIDTDDEGMIISDLSKKLEKYKETSLK
jgi:DNA-binding transcriptional MocR family regulator